MWSKKYTLVPVLWDHIIHFFLFKSTEDRFIEDNNYLLKILGQNSMFKCGKKKSFSLKHLLKQK